MPLQDSDQNGLAWGSQGTVYKLTGNTTIWQQMSRSPGWVHTSFKHSSCPTCSLKGLSLPQISPSPLLTTHCLSHRVHSQHTLFVHMFPHVCSCNTHSERGATKGKARRITKHTAGQEFWVLNVEGPPTPSEILVKIKETFPPEINKILHILSESPHAIIPSGIMSYRLSSL